MDKVAQLVNGLDDTNANAAYQCLQQLQALSESGSSVYPYFDTFAAMLDSENSYIRTRGLLLISANAKWDADNKIDKIIAAYLRHIADEKPITARQCIKALPNIAKHKPNLADEICNALWNVNIGKYASSMQGLVRNDAQVALKKIANEPAAD